MSERKTPTPPADWDRLAELHERARAAAPEERRALLAALRADAPALAGELEAMLEATPTAAGLELEARFPSGETPASLAAGDRVGPWRIVRFLARGGMGEVYLADRADGVVEQRAAVKLLRPGIASADLLERFRLERTLLARLEHPAVAPLLDAGTAADGRPYLALRYVDGRPITTYCAETAATPARRAGLFVELCRAVQFAHANLVVHRDLKPSNVLVSADGRVHLLDFGIAKLLGPRSDLDAATEPTRALELAPMTPQRAAPEQRRGEPVTTATDVWALGVLLHELFTGRLPATGADGHADPVAASTPGLDRDRAAIVGRALAREPQRRYASAGELADDVERWIAGEPVRARPDSLAYRTGRFVARHRVAVTVAIAATTALAALTVSSVASSRAAQREREIAERERSAAAREAERAEAVVDLVVELFGGLDPIAGAGLDTVRVSDLIALGEAKAAKLVGEPEIQARLRHTLGRIQLERSDWKSALALLAAARDAGPASDADDDLAAVQLELDYARALHSTGDRAGANEIARGVLERVESSDGAPDPFLHATALATLGAFEGGETGEARLVRALAILRALPQVEPTEIAAVCTSLGWLRSMRGAKDEARALFTEALAILREERGPTHPHTLGLESTLASLLADPAERLREHERILAVRRGKLGDRHYMVANSWSAIGKAKLELRDFAAAAEAYDLAATIWVETAGDSHPMAQAAFRNRDRARTAARTGELPPPPEQAHGRR
jgi:serine/threonine-protein kinase